MFLGLEITQCTLTDPPPSPPPPPPPTLGQEALHDSSLRYAKKTRALLDCEEQVNREGS